MWLYGKWIKAGDYGFSGACSPGGIQHSQWHNHTFSVGIFRWVLTKDGKGLKHGPVIKRVKGLSANPEKVYAEARRMIRLMKKGAVS